MLFVHITNLYMLEKTGVGFLIKKNKNKQLENKLTIYCTDLIAGGYLSVAMDTYPVAHRLYTALSNASTFSVILSSLVIFF